ncbi:hypothetical protein RUND412_008788 [Rhizina undulata]
MKDNASDAMDPLSIAAGVAGLVGLLPPLVTLCTEGYGLLSTARNVGEDWGTLEWQCKIEERRFNDWKELMLLEAHGHSAFHETDSEQYLLIVETLAKIVECFRMIDEHKSTYEPKEPINEVTGSVLNRLRLKLRTTRAD